MQRTLLALLGFSFGGSLLAQTTGIELVRNGSFESLSRSVNTYDQFQYVSDWSSATLGLPDVFDKRASAKSVGIPVNDYGTLDPQEGDRYAGFFGWKDDIRRNFGASDPEDTFKPGWSAYSEYLQSELVAPLLEGVTYEVVFHVALSQNSDRTILGVGAHFSEVLLNYQHRKFLEEVPDVFLPTMITEKGKWTEVRGRFVADGREQFIVIGVFPYVGLESEHVIEGTDNRYAYYYVDNVSVKRVAEEE